MSTAITPAKKRNSPLPGALVALAIGATLTGAYMLQQRTHEYHATHPTDPTFWQPGPPADLITMLQRGYDYSPFNPKSKGHELLPPTQAIVMKDLCHVILTDYHPYKYGSTQDDPAQQALVEQEAEQLLNKVSQLFTDKSQARRHAKLALAEQASDLYDELNLDPGAACKMIKPALDHPTSLF